jgi:RNA-directed DNA polymerase
MFEYLKRFRENFPNRKFFRLIDKVYDLKNLETAWKTVKTNNGCAGVDKQCIGDFTKQKGMYLSEIQRAIKNEKYNATPVLRKYIPKTDGKLRPLGIPTVKDRVIQQATKNVLEPIFEMKFKECSYGYRPDKSAHQAIHKISEHLSQGFTWVIDADIKGFFDSVDHRMLMSFVAEEISDGKVLNLIELWLTAGMMSEGKLAETTVGTPQGGVISPLLANIYLHKFDEVISSQVNARIVRYADDFVVMCRSKWMAQQVMRTVKGVLAMLKLELNTEKTEIVNSDKEEFEFLGFKFRNVRGKRRVEPKHGSIQKFKETVKQATRRNQPIKTEVMTGKLNYKIRGWGNYFKIGDVKVLYKELDVWIRMRVRSFIEKKKSCYAHQRISNNILQAKYKLASLTTLLETHSL